MGDIVLVLDVFSALLVLVALSRPVAARLSLTPVVLLAAIGVTISGASGALLRLPVPHWFGGFERLFADLPLPSRNLHLRVPYRCSSSKPRSRSDVRRILEDAAPILVLAVIATLAAAGMVGVALWPLAGLPLAVCLLLGAVVSTTDPVAVIAIFREVGAPARLTRLVEGEALLNDATAIVLYTVLLGVIVSGRQLHIGQGAVEFVISFGGGAALGVVAGRVLLSTIPWTRDDRLAEATLAVAFAYLSFIVADRASTSSGGGWPCSPRSHQ